MARKSLGGGAYAPLYVHVFPLVQPHFTAGAEKFQLEYDGPPQMTSTADKLCWYRYQKAMLQREVADRIGMDRSTYAAYEDEKRNRYSIEKSEQLARLYDIALEELLDEYHGFLFRGQGHQIRSLRRSLSMTQSQFAAQLGVPVGTLRN